MSTPLTTTNAAQIAQSLARLGAVTPEEVAPDDGPPPASAEVVLDRRHALRTLAPLIFAAGLSPLACSAAHEESPRDHHDDHAEEALGSVSSPLAPSDSVATAVNQSCTTTSVKGLATQLVEEIQCLRPATFVRIDNAPGFALGAAVFPYLQTNAAKNLLAAQKARGTTMSINSALRTLPQQYLLYRWYQTGQCGIGLAASPGTSNHEGAIAVDVDDNAGWRSAMIGSGFSWLGASDPVHYDFTAGGTVDLRGLSVEAFQRLWNRNNPTDTIAEDGSYGAITEARLAQAPSGGFAKGANCSKSAPDAGADAGHDPPATSPADVPTIPDATEPSGAHAPVSPAGTSSHIAPEASTGCVITPTHRHGAGTTNALGWSAAVALVLAARARRRRAR